MKQIIKQLRPVTTFAKIDIKRLFRDKVAIFFTFVFPLIFLFVFGGLFGNDNATVSFNIALINQSDATFTKQLIKEIKKNDVITVQSDIKTLAQAEEKMIRGEIDAAVVFPENFGELKNAQYPSGQAEIVYNKNNTQAAQTLAALFAGIFKSVNNEIVPTQEPFTVKTTSTEREGIRQFDYTFSGLVGFAILSLGIFGPTSVFPRLKQRGVLRRYSTTTLKVWQYFVGNVLSNVAVGLMSVGLLFAVAITLFKLNIQGDIPSLIVLIILGTVVIFGIGLAVGGWAKNENQAAPLANIITFPLMFLSGSFFPRFLMPEWLQTVSTYLPLTPVIDGARLIIAEGQNIAGIMPQISLLLVWLVVVYLVAFRVFRWE